MPTNNSTLTKIIGLALIVGGIGLAYWAYQLSGSLGAQLTQTFSGAMPDAVMFRYIGGAVCAVVGLFLVLRK